MINLIKQVNIKSIDDNLVTNINSNLKGLLRITSKFIKKWDSIILIRDRVLAFLMTRVIQLTKPNQKLSNQYSQFSKSIIIFLLIKIHIFMELLSADVL